MNKKLIKLSLAIIMIALSFPLHLLSTYATNSRSIGFYVSAVIPDNQINKDATYFDLLVNTDQKQTLEVKIINEESEDLTVNIAAISASTNINGVIDYITPDIKDETLKYPFSEIATVKENLITIAGNQTKSIFVDIALPTTSYDGIILGGIVITKNTENSDEALSSDSSVNIENNYSYVIGVKLTETDVTVLPNFELIKVEPQLINSRAAIVHYLRNSEAAIAKKVMIDLVITDLDTNETYLEMNKTIEMAPNSVFPLTTYPTDGNLASGNYESQITITLDGKDWIFKETFIISNDEAKDINNALPKESNRNSVFLYTLLIIVIILLFIIMILLFKRRKDDDESNEIDSNNL